ncbi:MAG: lysostaphin resistance A-like protein [Planctomycetota bacterium]|jgi:membrane protease YdiL (CAAX protease family)
MKDDVSTCTVDGEQHSLAVSVLLHLLPGVLILAFFLAVTPSLTARGFPTLFCLFLAVAAVLIPFELGYILYKAKTKTGNLSLNRTVMYRRKIPLWQYFALIPPMLLMALVSYFVIAPPIQDSVKSQYFYWLPAWFSLDYNLAHCSKPVLWATWTMGVLFNGIAGPVVEELYFRGYLLPRISRLKAWAPLLNVSLFSVYHFFSPWRNLERILALLPGSYIIQWKKNIYLGMIPHCLLNTTGMLLMLPLLLS